MTILDELKWRGAFNQATDEEGLTELLETKKIGLYVGIDPTGASMHIGHLIPFTTMKRFQNQGHKPFIVVGGATGSIGDPSGKKDERKLLDQKQIDENVEKISSQLEKLFGKDGFEILNNSDWLSKISMIDFLRDYGKLFPINVMIKRDVVASRLEAGISFTEFTYQILQAIDFLTLHKEHDVQLQLGGSDQFGNIAGGVELVHKIEGSQISVFGLTVPLLLKADGNKFGKSEDGTVWLDPNLTSPYQFYQFWINQNDQDVVKLLKFFTFLDESQINELEKLIESQPEKRQAQKALAEQVTEFVHGKSAVEEAQKLSDKLFNGDVSNLSADEIADAFAGVPSAKISKEKKNIVDFLVDAQFESSKRQAREDVTNGAISINGEKIDDLEYLINPASHYDGRYVLVRRGKKKYFLGITE